MEPQIIRKKMMRTILAEETNPPILDEQTSTKSYKK